MSYNEKLYPRPSLLIQEATNATEVVRCSQQNQTVIFALRGSIRETLTPGEIDSNQYGRPVKPQASLLSWTHINLIKCRKHGLYQTLCFLLKKGKIEILLK